MDRYSRADLLEVEAGVTIKIDDSDVLWPILTEGSYGY
jgi:hypothetical protein